MKKSKVEKGTCFSLFYHSMLMSDLIASMGLEKQGAGRS